MKNNDYKANQALFNADYEELRRVAAGTMNEVLADVMNDFYVLQQETEPLIGEQIISFLLQKIDLLVFGAIMTIIGLVIGNYMKKSRVSETI